MEIPKKKWTSETVTLLPISGFPGTREIPCYAVARRLEGLN